MDFSNDDVRRELRAGQREHDEVMPAFADAVRAAFDPSSETDPATKAALLGVPDRRGFLKIGGLWVALTTLAAACVIETKEPVQLTQTGTMPPTTKTPEKTPFPGGEDLDKTLFLTAISIEKLAIEAYQLALDKGLLTLPLLQDVAKYFRDQHIDHAAFLAAGAERDLGIPASTVSGVGANAYLKENVVDPAVALIEGEVSDKALAQTSTLKLALELEDAAAQTYTQAGGLLTKAAYRQAIMSIGAIEARHYSVLAGVVGLPAVPFAFGHVTGAAPPDSYITAG